MALTKNFLLAFSCHLHRSDKKARCLIQDENLLSQIIEEVKEGNWLFGLGKWQQNKRQSAALQELIYYSLVI